MSKHSSPNTVLDTSTTLETGIEAFQSSPEFRGPVEPLDGDCCNDHFAHIYESDAERFDTAVPFVRHGLEQGERVMYVIDESSEAEVPAALRDGGIDVDAALDAGQLSFHTVDETYLRNDSFDPDEMIDFYGDTVAAATEEYKALRIVAETSWLHDDRITFAEFTEYEAKVNDLFSETDSLAICQYDRDALDPTFLRNIVRTHPHLIYGGAVCHNFYYTPPAEFLGEDDPASDLDRMLGTLHDRTAAKTALNDHHQFLRDLYYITASQDRSFEAKLDALFELGCEWFDLDMGALNCVDLDADHLEVEYVSGEHDHFKAGGELPLSETYCQAATDIKEAAAVADPAARGFDDILVYEEFGVGGYLGTYIPVDGGSDRTLAFVSNGSREEPFTEQDKAYIELMGQWVGYELNRRQREQFLRECYEITADPTHGFDEKLDALFEIGCDRFNLDHGGLARIDPDTDLFEVERFSGDHDHLAPGAQIDLSETYCRALADGGAEATAPDPVGITDPEASGFADAACVTDFGVEAYLGTRLPIDDGLDRTFFFVADDPRDRAFSDTERTFHRLMGQWVQYELERQQRERDLRERTEHLNALIETTPDCIKTVAPDGTLLQMNPAGLEMGEADAESDVIGECVYDLVAPEDREKYREFNERICSGESGSLEFDIIGLEGTRRHMETHAAPLERPDGTTVQVAVTRDVTEQKERRAELRQTKDRFETVFEQSDDGIFIFDPNTDEIVDANPAVSEKLGYTREELLSMQLADLHPDGMEQVRAFVGDVRENGSAWTEDLSCRHKDGNDIPAEVTAATVTLNGRDLVLAHVRHIEERKKHERYQRDLYEIIADTEASFDEKLKRLLELGCERLGLENGYFNRIDAETHEFEVVEAVGPHDQIEPGAVDALDRTYCELHLSSTEPLAVPDAVEAGFDDLRACTQYGLEAYLAATVHVGGTEYGTLCFASETPREQPFTEAERSFLDLMGQCIGYELEHRRRERFLRESYEITAAPDRDFDTKLEQLLDLARDWMGLDAAGLTHLPERDGPFLSEYAIGYGGNSDGVVTAADDVWTNPSKGCYCRQAIVADEPVGKADVRGTEWEDDSIHQEHGLTCYLGMRVTSGSTPYGTLWVGSTTPREREFTETERTFLELIGQWVSYELERREHNDAQRELYEVTADADLATDEKIQQLLELGCERLDLPVGLVSRDCDEALAIEQMYGTHPQMDEGAVTPSQSDHFCRDVIETGEAVIVTDAAAAGWEGDPLFDDLGIRTYAGVPVVVGGDTYGTLGFADTSPREQPFTEAEQSFLDLMGQCIGYELEQARREDRLQALSALGHELLDTETAEEVSECFVQAIDHACNLPVAGVALYDDETGDLSPTVATDAAEHLFATASVFDRPYGAAWQAFISGETTRITELDGESVDGHVSITDAVVYPLDTYGVLVFGTTDPYGFRDGDLEVVETGVANMRAALARADREQRLQEREDVLEEQNETLARLNRINDTIRSIDQALVEASTRDEIEQVVCEEFAASGPYELAWIGDYDETAGEVRPVESAGSEKGYLDAITITTDDAPEGNGPTGRAIKTDEPQVVNNVLTDESFEPWRQDALNRGYQATAAFPLTYDDTRYGVLNLYASEPGVFDDLEQDVLTELSNTVAHTINAIENRKALISDAVTELKFTLHDTELSTAHVMRELECDLTVKRVVPQTNGGVRVFFTICGATADEVLEQEARLPITDLTVVSDSDGGADEATLFEATLTEESLIHTVIEHGGRLRWGEVTEDGNTQVVIHLGAGADTREFVEMFKRKFPSAELEAKRTTERGEQSALEVVIALTEELTDRQLETLQTAYFSGYFEEPRTRTASEIADTMNIAQPTFNSHLRTGTRKIYRQLFENELSVE